MTTRWEVEAAINASNVEPTGRHLVLWFLTKTTAATAEIPPAHAPTFTEMEQGTGLSRSTLIEWMKVLTGGRWIERVAFPQESRPGFRLMVGDPNAARPPRKKPTSRGKTVDAAYRQAVQPELLPVPTTGTARTDQRYADVPTSGTPDDALLLLDSPTESPTNHTTLDPAPPTGRTSRTPAKNRTSATAAEPREDVERICKYLTEWIIRNGSRRPTIGQEWRDEARRLIDLDKRPLDEIQKVIRWCQRDPFWRKNVLSMPKFRQQYDRLRLGWEDDPDNQRRGGGTPQGYQPFRDEHTDADYEEYISRGR